MADGYPSFCRATVSAVVEENSTIRSMLNSFQITEIKLKYLFNCYNDMIAGLSDNVQILLACGTNTY